VREDVKMRRCEDEKMRYRPPLLEEPCAQTLSGIIINVCPPKFVFYQKHKLKKNPGDTNHKKNQISFLLVF